MTTQAKKVSHTPGPWRVDGNQVQSEKINGYGNFILLEMPLRKEPLMQDMTAEDEANARLIAASPELLAACKLCLENYGEVPGMREAIAKAEWRKL